MAKTIGMLIRVVFGWNMAVKPLRSYLFFCSFTLYQQIDTRSLWLEGRSFASLYSTSIIFLRVYFLTAFHGRFETLDYSCDHERIVGTIKAMDNVLLL